jgi:hypothetical protein
MNVVNGTLVYHVVPHVLQVGVVNPLPPVVVPYLGAPLPAVIGFTPVNHAPNMFAHLLRAVPATFAYGWHCFSELNQYSAEAFHYFTECGAPVPPPNALAYNPLPARGLVPHVATFTPRRAIAETLATDLRDYPSAWTVRESDSDLPTSIRQMAKVAELRPIKVTCLFGVFGCGKTTAARPLVANDEESTWVFPSSVVASEALTSNPPLGPDAQSSRYIEGMEVFRKSLGTTCVLDDFTKLPPGSLDLLVLTNPQLEHLILTGDPCQSEGQFPVPTARSKTLDPLGQDALRLFPNATYATITHRLPLERAELLGLPTSSNRHGHYLMVSQPPPGVPFFATSPRFVETKCNGGTLAFVTSFSQGLDLDGQVALDLGGMSSSMTDAPAVVGLTRNKTDCFLVFDHATLPPRAGLWGSSTILSAMVHMSASTRRACLTAADDPDHIIARTVAEYIRSRIPSLRTGAALPFVGYNDSAGIPEDGLYTTDAAMHQLSFYYPLVTRIARAASNPPVTATVPVPEMAFDPINNFTQPDFRDASVREFSVGKVVSEQFPGHKHPGALHHGRADRATEAASYAKRLHLASAGDNIASIVRARQSSRFHQLRAGFLSQFPRFNKRRDFSSLLDLCTEEVLDSWCSKKTLKDVQRSLLVQDVDWDLTFTKTFLKSQVVRKNEKWGGNASAGQIVTSFPATKTFRDAVYALCLEKVVLEECPEHVYLHLRRTTEDLANFTSTFLKSADGFTETDFTAWDSSIDGPFFAFYAWMFQQLGFPADYIDTFVREASTTRFFGGNLRLMQHSGNRYTFLLNTLGNLAVTNAMYTGIRHTPQAFGGDDSLLAGSPTVSPLFRPTKWKMIPKVNHSSVGHLFGHLITAGNLTYDYEYMRNRLEVAIVERPYDTDFYRSFADQMIALPYVEDESYATVYTMLTEHVRARSLRIPSLRLPAPVMSWTPQSIFYNGVLPKQVSRSLRNFA